jgi:hypothetical protein
MTHHDSNAVVVAQRFRSEIAEHPQMAVLTVNAIFRGVMRVERCHSYPAGLIGVYRILAGTNEGNFMAFAGPDGGSL